jgi:N12 class adenine-specific DNA methylase
MSKLQRLRDNIAAIECALKGENNAEVLGKYSGFGGLGFILNGIYQRSWSKSDMQYCADTMRLYEILKENAKDTHELLEWQQSLKQSTLTAFYTPLKFVDEMMISLCGKERVYNSDGSVGVTYNRETERAFKNILDPAAGNGVFAKTALWYLASHNASLVAYEKDLLTGTILDKTLKGWNYCGKLESVKADVRIDGFETIPASELGTYDLVSTNVPFGDISVYDPAYTKSENAVRREAAKMIHRYYVLKGLDCLRDGGIEAYIITSNYLNNDSEQVQEALKQSRLIGAYRLANNLFKENGTEVGTDLLVLQKDVNKKELTADECMLLTTCEEGGCPTNMYFTCYPDHIVSTAWTVGTDAYGKRAFEYYHRGGVSGIAEQLGKVLAEDMKEKCDVGQFERGAKPCGEPQGAVAKKPATCTTGTVAKKKAPTKQEAALMALHGCYLELESNERTKQVEDSETRKNLNELYEEYVDNYGKLHDTKNKQMAKRLNMVELLALEIKDDQGEYRKADIFFKPVAFATEERTEPMTAHEALAASLNEYGKPNMPFMEDKTGKDEESICQELAGELFWNPLSNEYQIKAQFVSGNVVEKLANARRWVTRNGREMEEREKTAIAALEAAVPTPIPFADLDFNLGERWISADIYQQFASDFFSMPENRAEVRVKYAPEIDQYVVASMCWNERIRTQFSVTSETGNKVDGVDLLTHALHNTMPKLMKYKRNEHGRILTKINSKGETENEKEEDTEAVQLANSKIEEIRSGYVEWLQQQPKELRDKLADEYNRRFNCFVKPEYDGSHQTFPDLDRKAILEKYGVKDLYKSQKDCIWMLLLNGGGICDHEVGSGKTMIMCIAAHEMKRLGMCHKPMIIGLKANVSAIAETYRTCYPKAKVLFATEQDYCAANRVDFFNRMKTGDWDCIIMSHDQFGRIPQSLEIQRDITYTMLQQVEDSLDAVSRNRDGGYEITRKMQRGLEKRKNNLSAKLAKIKDDLKNRKDDVADFDELGIDHIFIDESHQFKNLGFVTRHDRVAGLGNVEGSQRAFNLLMALRTIQKKTGRDLGATFLSGTTVTNSLTELYLLFHYLRPKALEKQGITCFDAWAAIFTKKSQEYEFSLTNTIQLKERFRYFIKVPELAMFYNEITDYKTAEDVGIVRPKKDPVLLKLEPTPDQEEYIKVLMEFARTGDFSLIGIDNPTKQQENAKMLYATDLARKMSLDMRLIDPMYGDHPNNKVSRCAEKIYQWYKAFDEMKGTQLVFSDLSTWQGKSQWSVYGAIKDKLIDEYHIPADEIRFIQEAKNDKQKQEIIKLTNEGKVRVLFGSTSMLGTGVNAQKRVVCVHHLDTPWRPSDLEQRDGRAVRKGNEIAADWQDNKVKVIIYAVERSLDSYKFQLLHSKQVFISQLKHGQLNVRTLDEGAMDEKGGMNFAEYMAVLSGNRDLLERAKLEKRIAALEGERKNFYRERHSQEDKLASLQQQTEAYKANIESAQRDLQRFEQAAEKDAEGNAMNKIDIDGFAIDTDIFPIGSKEWTAAVARELMRIDNDTQLPPMQVKTIGHLYGFPIQIRTEATGSETHHDGSVTTTYRNVFSVKGEKIGHTIDNGRLNHGVLAKAAGYALECLLAIPKRLENWQWHVDNNTVTIKQLESILAVEWGKDDALRQMKQDLVALDKKIGASLKKTDDEVKDIATENKKELPYKFSIDRGDTTVTFKRSLLSLVSISEMKQLCERLVEGIEGWRKSHWSLSDGWSWRGETRYHDEVSVEFTLGEKAEAFILEAMRLQEQRANDKAWLKEHAGLASNGTEVTRDNETILAAREMLKPGKKAA